MNAYGVEYALSLEDAAPWTVTLTLYGSPDPASYAIPTVTPIAAFQAVRDALTASGYRPGMTDAAHAITDAILYTPA